MAVKDAAEVLAQLQAAGHNYNPEKQLLKADLAAHTCIVYDDNNAACSVKASDLEQYVAKGMTLEPKPEPFEPSGEDVAEEAAEVAPPAPAKRAPRAEAPAPATKNQRRTARNKAAAKEAEAPAPAEGAAAEGTEGQE